VRTPFQTIGHSVQGLAAEPERLVFNFKFEDWQILQQKQQESAIAAAQAAKATPAKPAEGGSASGGK